MGNRVPERNPVTQVRAAAKWLDGLLRESTGRVFQARGVVAFPGWFVEHEGRRGDVWVLEPKALAAYHLSRYVRASEAESR